MVTIKDFDPSVIWRSAHSPLKNYAIPGLTSYLIGNPGPAGTVRLFHSSRLHQEPITPHSHRFDFTCVVLKGEVTNRVWSSASSQTGDLFQTTRLNYKGEPGKYEAEPLGQGYKSFADYVYHEGHTYSMKAEEIHSIYFGKNTEVLFFEGPSIRDYTVILEPVAYGEVVPTFKVEPWMFKKPA